MSISILVLLFLIGNSFAVSAITGSMGNARMVLYPEFNGKTYNPIDKTILVKNINNVSINISLKADSDGEKFLEIIDKEFTLQPNEEKKAEFLVKVKDGGRYEGKINVFFTPAEGKGAGVVLSSTIIAIAKENSNNEENAINNTDNKILNINSGETSKGTIFLVISSVILLVILIFLLSMIKKKKRNKK